MLTVDFLTDISWEPGPHWALSGWQQWLAWDQSWGEGLGSTHSGPLQGLPQLLSMLC